jgi:CRISPR-associated exonuclease Cas4
MQIASQLHSEEALVPLSALQHWLYCPRQCALIHVERAWQENHFTAEGKVMHENAHTGRDESRGGGVRITRSMPVASYRHGLVGQCDVVEFHRDGRVLPIEYKRGKPKAHRADEVQLCAQAMCLEEMLETCISHGALYYGEKRRRVEVCLDDDLRGLVLRTAAEVRECLAQGATPLAEYVARRCDGCSLLEVCQPHALRLKRGVAAWFSATLKAHVSAMD